MGKNHNNDSALFQISGAVERTIYYQHEETIKILTAAITKIRNSIRIIFLNFFEIFRLFHSPNWSIRPACFDFEQSGHFTIQF